MDSLATTNVDLSDEGGPDAAAGHLAVDISDALSEREWVKFTVHTKTTMANFAKTEFSVNRLHEEFLWLHDTLEENPAYAGCVIPPAPPRPDFDASREKLKRLGDSEGNLTRDEFNKMKQELEAEYLATFKKTVAMHETFLCRLVAHPVFRTDRNLAIFLEYDKDLNVRGKNKKEKLTSLFSSFQKSGDELLLSSTVKDVDGFFEAEKNFLLEYHNRLRDCTVRSDKMTAYHRSLADTYIKISTGINDLASNGGPVAALPAPQPTDDAAASAEQPQPEPVKNNPVGSKADQQLAPFLLKLSGAFEKMRRIEGRVASDQDLKLSDVLRYHMRDTSAAKNLLYRRLRCLANYENANKSLDKARARNRDVAFCENAQTEACQTFEQISVKAKEELKTLRTRRVASFQKSLTELAELELKHSRAHAQMLRATIGMLKEEM